MKRAVPLLESQPPTARIPGSWIPGGILGSQWRCAAFAQRHRLATWVTGTVVGTSRNRDDNWGRDDGSLDGELTTVARAPVLDDYDVVSAARCVCRAYG
jgi:hypothetical protein